MEIQPGARRLQRLAAEPSLPLSMRLADTLARRGRGRDRDRLRDGGRARDSGTTSWCLIDAVDDQGSMSFVSIATIRSSNSIPCAYNSASINSSTRMTSKCEADSIAEPLAIV
jgi:hypothetical protein